MTRCLAELSFIKPPSLRNSTRSLLTKPKSCSIASQSSDSKIEGPPSIQRENVQIILTHTSHRKASKEILHLLRDPFVLGGIDLLPSSANILSKEPHQHAPRGPSMFSHDSDKAMAEAESKETRPDRRMSRNSYVIPSKIFLCSFVPSSCLSPFGVCVQHFRSLDSKRAGLGAHLGSDFGRSALAEVGLQCFFCHR